MCSKGNLIYTDFCVIYHILYTLLAMSALLSFYIIHLVALGENNKRKSHELVSKMTSSPSSWGKWFTSHLQFLSDFFCSRHVHLAILVSVRQFFSIILDHLSNVFFSKWRQVSNWRSKSLKNGHWICYDRYTMARFISSSVSALPSIHEYSEMFTISSSISHLNAS